MASSQRTMQSVFHGKTILSKLKYVIRDYCEWEAKKFGHGVNYALKIANVTGKWFQQSLEYITICLLQTIICLHSCRIISEEYSHENKIITCLLATSD